MGVRTFFIIFKFLIKTIILFTVYIFVIIFKICGNDKPSDWFIKWGNKFLE